MGKSGELETIWEVPDELWAEIKKILDEIDPPRRTGRPRIDGRRALNGIIYRLRTSCQWNHLPEKFGSDSSVHRTFQRWLENGLFEKVWALLVERCDEMSGVVWQWYQPMVPWARPAKVGPCWTEPDGQGQGRDKEKHPG